MRLVSGVAIGLSFLNLTVRKSSNQNVQIFLFSQALLKTGISSSLICLILRLLQNLGMTLVHYLNKSVSICIVNFSFCIALLVACNFYFYIL